MEGVLATEAGTSVAPNEDWVGATSDVVVLLDGVTARTETGCRHGVNWFVNMLGPALVETAQDHSRHLGDVLACAIRGVAAKHRECDLSHPASPSAAVAMVRIGTDTIQYLVVADVFVVIEITHENLKVVTDNRVDLVAQKEQDIARQLPTGSIERERALKTMKQVQLSARNREDGFWVAAADPAVADHAVIGTLNTHQANRIAILSDGAARCVTLFDSLTWRDVLNVLHELGPEELIRHVRKIESTDPENRRWPRNKRGDDASVYYRSLAPGSYSSR